MPDTKITALTALTAADPANDVLPIVDVSDTTMAASGTTKKISVNNILGCSGTATLASATISGDLTVDTSTLKVDSANNRVGIGTASPTVDLEVGDGTGTRTLKISGATNIFDIGFGSLRGGSTYGDVRLWTDRFRVYNAAGTQIIKNISGTNGDETWYDGAGGTRMTLNSSGLGVGVTPSAKLHVEGGGAQARFSIASASDARHEYYRNGIREGLITWDANVIGLYATQSSGEVVIASSNTIRVRVKAGGQVRFVPLASDPAGAEAGDVYYNSTSNKLKCYNGTTWNDLF